MLTNEEFNFKNLKIFKSFKKLFFGAVLGIAIFSINPLTAYAGREDTETEPENNADDVSTFARLEEYCSFW